jgi:hypothetical protein
MTDPTGAAGIDFPFTVWGVTNMDRKLDELGTVYTVHYTVTRFKDGEQAGAYGSLGFEAPEAGTGTPYAQLTKDEVIGWITTQFGDEKIANIEQQLDDQIAEKLAPTHSSGVPW